MNLICQVFTYILIVWNVSYAGDQLNLCTFDQHLINIKLDCPKEKRLHMLEMWTVILRNNSAYCDDISKAYYERLVNVTSGVTREMIQKILKKCTMAQSCSVGLYPGHYVSKDTYGIVVKYDCVQATKIIPLCKESDYKRRQITSDIYLFHYTNNNSKYEACKCMVNYTGENHVSLTHIPNHGEYLEVTKWSDGTGQENKSYNEHIYTNETVAYNPERTIFTIINSKGKMREEDTVTLLRIAAATDDASYFSMQCNKLTDERHRQTAPEISVPAETRSSVTENIVICVICVICIMYISVCGSVFYRRHVRKGNVENVDSSQKNNVDTSEPQCRTKNREQRTEPSSSHTSVYVDCTGTLSGSYAEVGSISDYRHYHCPDEMMQNRVTVTVKYQTLSEENCDIENNQAHNEGITPTASPQQELNITQDDEMIKYSHKNQENTEKGKTVMDINSESTNERPVESARSILDSKDDHNGVKNSTSQKRNKPRTDSCLRRFKTMISQEHYDPFGYLNLDIAEKTSNASLQKWKKEIYSIEHAAHGVQNSSLKNTLEPHNPGMRITRIDGKPQCCKSKEYPYSYVNKHWVKFEDDDAHSRAEVKEKRSSTADL